MWTGSWIDVGGTVHGTAIPNTRSGHIEQRLPSVPTLADLGYDAVGIGIQILVKQLAPGRDLDIDTHTRNALLRSLRCLGERGFPLLTGRWRTLYPYHCSPARSATSSHRTRPYPFFEYGYIKSR